MATELAAMVNAKPEPVSTSQGDLSELSARLEAAGYALRANIDFADMAAQRAQAQSAVAAMANHLGQPSTVLVRR
jgi:hypothetical protein